MMEKLIDTLVVQVPHMSILAFVVIAFIKYLKYRDKIIQEAFNQRDTTISEMHKENSLAREQSRQVIEKNTVAATQNTEAMSQMTHVLREFLKRSTK